MVELGKLVVSGNKASVQLPINDVVIRILPQGPGTLEDLPLPFELRELDGKMVRISIEKATL